MLGVGGYFLRCSQFFFKEFFCTFSFYITFSFILCTKILKRMLGVGCLLKHINLLIDLLI